MRAALDRLVRPAPGRSFGAVLTLDRAPLDRAGHDGAFIAARGHTLGVLGP